uniref:Ig-like domain-containing protein n=1 Tax=Acrobeloides nanus TaxID=290746 RepID=A0A914EAA6_9BILA
MWKPKETYIARKIQSFSARIKDRLKKFLGTNKRRENQKNNESYIFTWQKFENGRWSLVNNGWAPLIENASRPFLHPTDPTYTGMFTNIMNSLLKKDRKKELGDHFELLIPNVGHQDEGWYRCVHMVNGGVNNTMQVYYVEVISDFHISYVTPTLGSSANSSGAYLRPSHWTQCNKCNATNEDEQGEQRREHKCYIRNSTRVYGKALRAFGSIPCSSQIIGSLREKLSNIPVYEEYKPCNRTCPPPKENDTLTEYGWAETGEKMIIDKLDGNEYSFNERLPLLHQKVERQTIEATEDEPIMLDCNTGGPIGIIWYKENETLTSAKLQKDDKNERVYITAANQLVFKHVILDDSGFYSCMEFPELLLRTWMVIVNERVDKEEYVSWVKIVFRFLILLLLLYLFYIFVVNTSERMNNSQRNDDIDIEEDEKYEMDVDKQKTAIDV